MEEIFPFLDLAELRLTALLCGGAFVFLGVLYVLGRIFTRRRHDSVIPMLMAVGGLLALIAAVSVFLDAQPTIPALIIDKHEVTDTQPDGTWEHQFRVVTQFTVPGAGEPRTEDLSAEEELYDSLGIGDEVEVRFWDAGGWFEFARLASRSTFSILWGSGALVFPSLIAGVVLVGLVIAKKTDSNTNGIFAGMGMIVLIVLAWQMAGVWWAMLPLGGPQATAVATIRDIDLYTEVRSSENDEDETVLIQPFELIEVTFVPEDWQDPVVALDRVDADSIPSLEIGGTVPIVYQTDSPRQIRIQEGERTYVWKNPLFSLVTWGIILGIVLISWRGRGWLRRWRSKATPME
jgi:hypothetical protein